MVVWLYRHLQNGNNLHELREAVYDDCSTSVIELGYNDILYNIQYQLFYLIFRCLVKFKKKSKNPRKTRIGQTPPTHSDFLIFFNLTKPLIVDKLTAQNGSPTAFCSRIMSLGTNVTWPNWKILSSGSFWFLLLFCPNSRPKFKFQGNFMKFWLKNSFLIIF